MLVGILAGLLCFGFLKVYGEPQVDVAIGFETAMDEAKAKAEMAKGMPMPADEPELVSREKQASWGLLTGVMAYNIAFGGLFALGFAFVYGRLEATSSPRTAAVLVALTGFVAIYLVPNLKYPANPPSVGNPDTIGIRTGLYFMMIVLSLGTMILAANMRKALVPNWGGWNATIIVGLSYLVVMVIVSLLAPVINEVPDGFPAVTLWKFRCASMGAQLIMWSTLALVFGALAEKLMTSKRISASV
jgi:hypothetical protein